VNTLIKSRPKRIGFMFLFFGGAIVATHLFIRVLSWESGLSYRDWGDLGFMVVSASVVFPIYVAYELIGWVKERLAKARTNPLISARPASTDPESRR
jgi:hypothetical protein